MADLVEAVVGGHTASALLDVTVASGEVVNALANPSAFGWPDATNTGIARLGLTDADLTAVGSIDVNQGDVRENGVIRATRPSSGSTTWGPITLFPDRTRILRGHINGRLRQRSGVYLNIDESHMEASGPDTSLYTVDTFGKQNWTSTLTKLTDCTVEAKLDRFAIAGGLATADRCNISGGEDNISLASFVNLADCYLHGLQRKPDSHNDSFECIFSNDSSAVHCTILAAVRLPDGQGVEYPDGWYDPMNAVLMIGNSNGPVKRITFENCLVDGGNYTFNDNWQSSVHEVEDITVRGCRFGRHFRYGPRSTSDASTDPTPPTWIWEANVWDDTNEPV